MFESPLFFGNEIIEVLHGLDSELGGLFRFVSFLCHHLGSNIFFMSLLSIVYLLFSPQLGSYMAYGLLSAGIVNSLAKFFCKSPRPYNLESSIAILQESAGEFAFGFPSGHVHTSVVVWGILFFFSRQRFVRIFSALVILLMPFSRMYLGVHFLGDVVGGLILGILNLAGVLWFVKKFPTFLSLERYGSGSRILRTWILGVIALSLAPVLLFDEQLKEPEIHSLNNLISSSASLGGVTIGLLLLRTSKFEYFSNWEVYSSENQLSFKTILIRIAFLVGCIFFLYIFPSIILKQFSWGNDILVRYLRYLVVGYTIVFILPYILFHFKNGEYFKSSFHV